MTSITRLDLLGDLRTRPTHFPPQTAIVVLPRHIDALGVDDRIVPYVTQSGIDDGVLRGILPSFSAHKPLWAQWHVTATPRVHEERDIVFRLSAATQPQWDKAKQRLQREAGKWLPTACARAAAAPTTHRAATVDTLSNELASMLHAEYAATIGTVKIPVSSAARWSPELSVLSRRIHGLRHRRYHQLAQDIRGCRTGEEMPRDLAPQLKSLKSFLRTKIRRHSRKHHQDQVKRASTLKGTSQLWKTVRQYEPAQQATLGDQCKYKGTSHEGPEVPVALTSKMKDSHTANPRDPAFDQQFHDSIKAAVPVLLAQPATDPLSELPFTPAELKSVLTKLSGRPTKSPGPDGIRYWMITESGSAFQNALLWFFNLVWDWEQYPTPWGHSHIRYIHKKNDKFDLSNYRPISLISCLGKAFTCLILPRLQEAIQPYIAPEQGGFQKQSGCIESLWTLTALVDCSIAHLKRSGARGAVYTVFCDTKEAFDSVWREGLYFILHAYGVRGKLLRLIAAWHTGATATGLWYNAESQPIQYSQGVRQGCVLAPALYAVFINPLFGDTPLVHDHPFPALHAWAFSGGLAREEGLFTAPPTAGNNWQPRRVPGLAFADDVGLASVTRLGLERNLQRYSDYCHKWRSTLSEEKYHFVVFGAQSRTILPLTCPGGYVAPAEKSARYLGAVLDSRRTSGLNLDYSTTKGRTGSQLLYQIAHTMGEEFADAVTMRKVLPAALYGLEAGWLNDPRMKQLDEISALCDYRAHLLPFSSNSECRDFETSNPTASELVASQQVNMYLKFVQKPHPIRTPLLATVADPLLSDKTSRYHGWKRTVGNLRKVGVNLQAVPPGPSLTNHKRHIIVKRVRARLLKDRTKALLLATNTAPVRTSGARSKLDLFHRLVDQAPQTRNGPKTYSESSKLGLISNTAHRSTLRHIRCGLVQVSDRPSAISFNRANPCSCDPTGLTIRDPTHVVLECPRTASSRTRVLHALRHDLPLKHPTLRVTATQDDQRLILSSLGAPVPQLPRRAPLYTIFLQAAAAAWSKEAVSLGVVRRVSA